MNTRNVLDNPALAQISPGCCALQYLDPHQPPIIDQVWNFSLGREVLPGIVATASYVGTHASNPPVGDDIMNRGNNGLLLMGNIEIQISDPTTKIYPDGQAAAAYAQTPPLVTASLPPGRWEVYDIVRACFVAAAVPSGTNARTSGAGRSPQSGALPEYLAQTAINRSVPSSWRGSIGLERLPAIADAVSGTRRSPGR